MAIHNEKKNASGTIEKSATGNKITALQEYFEGSRAELSKVTWPAAKEVKATTKAVLLLVVVMAIFLGLVDLGLVKIVELILTSR